MSKKLLICCFLVLLGVGAYFFLKKPERIELVLHTLVTGDVDSSVSNTRVGTVKACRRAYLAPAMGGNVERLFVKEGDQVKRNQLLLAVWNADLKAQLTLQQAHKQTNKAVAKQACELAAGAERDAQRLVRLKKFDRIISEEQIDRVTTAARAQRAGCQAAQATVGVAEANFALAKVAIERTLVRAPFDGTVAEINAELGEYVTPSPPGIPTLPPIDLLDVSCLYVSAPIDEVDAPQLEVGMSACISLDAFTGKRCSGVLTRIAPYVLEKEKQARTVEVEIKLSAAQDLQDLLPGYSADIEILLVSKVDVVRVPREAVLGNNKVLMVGAEGLLEERIFEPGIANWHFIEAQSGLAVGDTIVLSVGREDAQAGAYVGLDK